MNGLTCFTPGKAECWLVNSCLSTIDNSILLSCIHAQHLFWQQHSNIFHLTLLQEWRLKLVFDVTIPVCHGFSYQLRIYTNLYYIFLVCVLFVRWNILLCCCQNRCCAWIQLSRMELSIVLQCSIYQSKTEVYRHTRVNLVYLTSPGKAECWLANRLTCFILIYT
jgi:hypothetical protein